MNRTTLTIRDGVVVLIPAEEFDQRDFRNDDNKNEIDRCAISRTDFRSEESMRASEDSISLEKTDLIDMKIQFDEVVEEQRNNYDSLLEWTTSEKYKWTVAGKGRELRKLFYRLCSEWQAEFRDVEHLIAVVKSLWWNFWADFENDFKIDFWICVLREWQILGQMDLCCSRRYANIQFYDWLRF